MNDNNTNIIPDTNDQPNNSNKNKLLAFVLKNKYYVGLVIIILVIYTWSSLKLKSLQNNFQNEKATIINSYELQLDSLNIERMQLIATTLSWAIRGELLRNNKEQISQYFNEFVKKPNIVKLQFINPDNGIIEISTDKKDEGTKTNQYLNINEQLVESDSLQSNFITPITGLNHKIGILSISMKNLKK